MRGRGGGGDAQAFSPVSHGTPAALGEFGKRSSLHRAAATPPPLGPLNAIYTSVSLQSVAPPRMDLCQEETVTDCEQAQARARWRQDYFLLPVWLGSLRNRKVRFGSLITGSFFTVIIRGVI